MLDIVTSSNTAEKARRSSWLQTFRFGRLDGAYVFVFPYASDSTNALRPLIAPTLSLHIASLLGRGSRFSDSLERCRRSTMPDTLVPSGAHPLHRFVKTGKDAAKDPFHDRLIEQIQTLEGSSTEVLEHPEPLEMILPIQRTDFRICQSYAFRRETSLNIPFLILSNNKTSTSGARAYKNGACTHKHRAGSSNRRRAFLSEAALERNRRAHQSALCCPCSLQDPHDHLIRNPLEGAGTPGTCNACSKNWEKRRPYPCPRTTSSGPASTR